MKLYRPVLIESAEQAEALPIGTIATVGEPPIESSVKWDDRLWYAGRDFEDGAPSRRMVGALALVPVEAEEETVEKRKLCQKTPDVLRRYVTEWQHYTAEEQNR